MSKMNIMHVQADSDKDAKLEKEDSPPSSPHPPLPPSPLSEADITSGRRCKACVVAFSGIHTAVLNNPDAKLFQHPLAKLQFLVGRKGKNEVGLLGGAWDPQDGAHPLQDPAALIATARRCFKDMTGVDLAPCTSW